MTYPKCWRNREDCDPIHCIDAEPEGLTEEQVWNLDYQPLSFICSGKAHDPIHRQDQYRLCFKNEDTDEMTDNDMQDMTGIIAVCSAAMALDAIQKSASGIVEIPAAHLNIKDKP